ncbi:hypothetical protein QVD17_35204 [Tagetes erecta]|uniref:Myb/SANT-like DNA-binding domain-containing protein n=1 Tax=Tagetes erecta TaxID=13708 RepID=A0AAD8NM61_TARER|nr:hypothetical protein QVD17_35204 [Tagetes erecta]
MSASNEPVYSISLQPPLPKSGSRRLPAPCWSDEETVALIQVYRDKWYSLRRGNLRAPDWQDVADGVAARCNGGAAKTSIQCRHKMEKLRKRYRSEIQRIGNVTKGYASSWVHFRLMDSMELGVNVNDRSVVDLNDADADVDDDDVNGDEIEEDLMLCGKRGKQSIAPIPVNRRYPGSGSIGTGASGVTGNGVRIKIPNFGSGSLIGDDLPPVMNPRYGSRNGYRKEVIGGENVKNDIVGAIEKLGDRFVKMEKMKMDMARELETMRMNAEMKQTEMILETHRKIWDMFVVEKESKKKMKRMSTPEL